MDYTKMLLASKIRDISIELREEDRRKYGSLSTTEEFEENRPLLSYARIAVGELRQFAELIDPPTLEQLLAMQAPDATAT